MLIYTYFFNRMYPNLFPFYTQMLMVWHKRGHSSKENIHKCRDVTKKNMCSYNSKAMFNTDIPTLKKVHLFFWKLSFVKGLLCTNSLLRARGLKLCHKVQERTVGKVLALDKRAANLQWLRIGYTEDIGKRNFQKPPMIPTRKMPSCHSPALLSAKFAAEETRAKAAARVSPKSPPTPDAWMVKQSRCTQAVFFKFQNQKDIKSCSSLIHFFSPYCVWNCVNVFFWTG